MRQITAVTGAMVLMLMAWPSLTLGWWDTQTRAQKPEPLVAEYQATAHAPADADVRDDEQADGGQGGQVVHLKPGQGLTLTADMPRGVYSIWVIARADEADFNPPQGDAKQQAVDLPGGEITMEWARQPIYTFLEVEGPNGERERWYMPITYREDYAIVSKLYFPVHIEGEHTVRVGFDERSETGLLVDRVELRDVLGLTARQGAKTQRMLTSDQELRERRARFAQTGQIEGWKNTPRDLQPRERVNMPNRLARNDALWSILPAWNTIEADPTHGFRHGAWDQVAGGERSRGVTPHDDSAERGVAVSVRVGDDRQDVLFNSLKPETVHELEDGTRVAGEFGYISEDAEGLRMLHLVGGTELSRNGISVRTERAAWEATIETVDYRNHAMTLSQSMPVRLLDGQVALLGNEQHWTEFELGKVNGTSATVVRTPRYYQSRIESVNAVAGTITTELEPLVYGPDTQHTHGTTITNEAHDTFWKAHVEAAERWIYLGWPGTRLSSPDHITMDDVPDANGDGRQTIKLMSVRADQPSEEASTVLIELEVTRVDVEENLVYFKMPTDEEYQQGGWQFAWRDLVNEDASKRWVSTYPGTSFAWKVEQAQVSREQLLVPGTDQLGKLYAYHFGPGDAFRVQSFVHLSRVRPGLYELRANVPCELTLPGAGDVAISRDGQRFDSIEAAAADGSVKINLTADQLGDGHVWLRIGK